MIYTGRGVYTSLTNHLAPMKFSNECSKGSFNVCQIIINFFTPCFEFNALISVFRLTDGATRIHRDLLLKRQVNLYGLSMIPLFAKLVISKWITSIIMFDSYY